MDPEAQGDASPPPVQVLQREEEDALQDYQSARALRATWLVGLIFFFVFSAFYTLQGFASLLIGPSLASTSLATLYGVFTAACLVAPAVVNQVGARRGMFLGILGYAAFSISTLLFALVSTPWTRIAVVVGGACNGLGAAILWTAQGRFMLDCAAADSKRGAGDHFAIFWALFNSSAVAGGVATFLYFSTATAHGNAALFAGFTGLMLAGAACTFGLSDMTSTSPNKTVGSSGDEYRAIVEDDADVKSSSLTTREEVKAFVSVALSRRALLLAPIFWYTGFSQPFKLNGFGDAAFQRRLVGLELAGFYLFQVLAGVFAANLLEHRFDVNHRRKAAVAALKAFVVLSAPSYAAGLYWEQNRRRSAVSLSGSGERLILPTATFLVWGFADSLIQAYCYWLIDALWDPTGPERSRAVALYKLVQSAGWCAGFALLPPNRCPYFVQLILVAVFAALGTLLALFELPVNDGEESSSKGPSSSSSAAGIASSEDVSSDEALHHSQQGPASTLTTSSPLLPDTGASSSR